MIVTSISPTYIANCIRFDCEDGSKQLMCILQGSTSSFKISSTPDYNPRIRFIDKAFKEQICTIACKEQEERIPLLCQLLVEQVSKGRVIVETKNRDGKVVAITSPQLADHAKTKKYDNVELAGKGFFEEIAQAFDTNLQTILAQVIAFNKQQNSPEAQHEAAKKQRDMQIVVPKAGKIALSGFIATLVRSVSDLFKITSKAQAKFIAEARDQARHSAEKQRQSRRKERRKKSEDKKRDAIKADIALQTRKLADTKKQTITVRS